jgi:hypothetical protein
MPLLEHSGLGFFSFTPDFVSVLEARRVDSSSGWPVTAARLFVFERVPRAGGCSLYAISGCDHQARSCLRASTMVGKKLAVGKRLSVALDQGYVTNQSHLFSWL